MGLAKQIHTIVPKPSVGLAASAKNALL